MALSLGNPTLTNTSRTYIAETGSVEALLLVGSSQDAALVLLNSSTELVRFALNATQPLNAASNGACTLNFQSSSATASAGSGTAVNAYRIEDQAGTSTMSGTVTGSDTITSGQTVNVGTITLTVPAS